MREVNMDRGYSDKTVYYKTLVNGKSFHGGDMEWSLPNGGPGKWHTHKGKLEMCHSGLHLTSEPTNWWAKNAKCYEAEYQGEVLSDNGDKICVGKVRLVRELTPADLAKLNIFVEGSHIVTEGHAWASDSARVRAYGSASVTAYGYASVEAYDSASVEASGSASVRAYGSTRVSAYGSTRVRAYDFASVEAYDSASVEAYDSASVRAYGSASVTASGSASVTKTPHSKTKVTLTDLAIEIDRTTNPPTVRGNFQV